MQKHLAIGRGVKILDQKNRGGVQRTPPASLRVKYRRRLLLGGSGDMPPGKFLNLEALKCHSCCSNTTISVKNLR